MIEIKLEDWEESDLKRTIVEKVASTVIEKEFKTYGKIPKGGFYTPYDKFKNYVANLVADRIFDYMVNNEEIKKRIDAAIEKATKTIINQYMKKKATE